MDYMNACLLVGGVWAIALAEVLIALAVLRLSTTLRDIWGQTDEAWRESLRGDGEDE